MLSCCNDEQSFFLVTFVFYLLAVRILWFSKIMKPFKLWTTFMHEFSHALAAWATCNKVTGIEVNENEGGLTHWKGPQKRMRCSSHFVLPAGYLGSTAWGVAIILSCVGRLSAQVMGCILVAALALCLLFALFGKTNEQHRSRSKVPDRSGGGAAPLTALRARDEPRVEPLGAQWEAAVRPWGGAKVADLAAANPQESATHHGVDRLRPVDRRAHGALDLRRGSWPDSMLRRRRPGGATAHFPGLLERALQAPGCYALGASR